MPIPDNINTIIPEFGINSTVATAIGNNDIASIQSYKKFGTYTWDTGAPLNSKNNIFFAMSEYIDKIKASDSYNSDMKNVADELSNQIYGLNDRLNSVMNPLGFVTELNKPVTRTGTYDNVDPVTGVITKETYNTTYIVTDLDTFTHPQTSVTTNLDSALICVVGDNKDNLAECKK
jgi:hypothetical protein